MRMLLKKHWFISLLLAVGMSLSVTLAALLLLQNLSAFLSFDPQFQAIFAQICGSKMDTPVWLLLVLSYGFCFPAVRFCRSRASRVVAVLGGLLLWVLLLAVAIYLTRVNGIMFGDVLISLLDMIRKGGLDGL